MSDTANYLLKQSKLMEREPLAVLLKVWWEAHDHELDQVVTYLEKNGMRNSVLVDNLRLGKHRR